MQHIAIIGIGTRFPGSSNTAQQFFENLKNKKDCIVPTPKNRWSLEFFQDSDKNRAGKLTPNKGGFMDNLYDFDNEAFNMSAKEAANIDPQQKVLLEVVHQALEDSNIHYRGSNTGVFIGTGAADFVQLATSNPYYVNEYTSTGGSIAIQANRVSFAFDLRGPSMSIDSACSAAGSALHIAMRCLQYGDCEQAIVGGINMLQNHSMTIAFSKLGVLSPNCRCASFDADADGYVRSEGCGVIVLKPLQKALQDGNHIYSVIHAVRCNEDGAQSPSLTMPSYEAQESLIEKTLKESNIDPKDIFYVEAHGTGTPVGDPIETNAIGKLLCSGALRSTPLKIGSVKTNIGHLEFASAVASIVKCSLMMDKKVLLPTIHFKKPNPKIRFDKYNMMVQTEVEPFDATNKLMMVSSFGFGGANACIILGAPPKKIISGIPSWRLSNSPYLFPISAMSKAALTAKVDLIKSSSCAALTANDLCALLSTRQQFASNKYLTYGVGEKIETAKFVDPIAIATQRQPIVFVFSGQGPQHIAMGRQLYKTFPKFKQVIDECDALYKQYGGISVLNDLGLFGDHVCADKNSINTIELTLPGLIFIQIGLYELWKSFGVAPSAIVGHSFGEMCAIYASGAATLKDIICVTIARTSLMKTLGASGTMLAVGLSAQETEQLLKENQISQLWIAAINSPQAITLGGTIESVKQFAAICKAKNVFNRQLNVTNAFHTPLMSVLRNQAHTMFKEMSMKTCKPAIPVISTVTGAVWDQPFEYTYFWDNIEKCVLFSNAIGTAMNTFGEDCIFLEMAPHPVLSMSIRQCGGKNIIYSQHREEVQQSTLLQSAAKLAALGFDLDWKNIVGTPSCESDLPPYPYQRKEFFNENEIHREERLPSQFGELLGIKLIHHEPTFQTFVNTKSYDWTEDHKVQGSIIFPAAGYIELMLEALGSQVGNVQIKNPLLVPDNSGSFTMVQTLVKQHGAEIVSKRESDSTWTMHAIGCKINGTQASNIMPVEALEDIKKRCNLSVLSKEDCYKRFLVMNLNYGYHFQCIEELHQGDEESFGILSCSHLTNLQKYVLHPAILDCCFQTFLGAIQSSAYMYLPTACKSVQVMEKPTSTMLVHCTITCMTDKDMTGNIDVFSLEGKLLVQVKDFICTKVASGKQSTSFCYTTVWQERAFPNQSFVVNNAEFGGSANEWQQVFDQRSLYEQAMSYYISKLPAIALESLPLHSQRHLQWCQKFASEHPLSNDFSLDKLDSIPNFEKERETIHRVGKNLPDLILNKENAVSRIMFNDDLIASLYQSSVTFKPALDMFATMISQLKIEQNRVIRILEIGSGTGTLSKKILPLLKQLNTPIEYFFTDVSASFFLQDKRLKEYNFVQYKVIDIEKPLQAQGIENSSIDIVLGFDVIHTARNLQYSVNNIFQTLVPNGLLCLIEPTVMIPYMHFIFGVFREWWHFEDSRAQCCLSEKEWHTMLNTNGFSNVACYHLNDTHVHSIVVAKKQSAMENHAQENHQTMVIQNQSLKALLKIVQQKIESKNDAPLLVVTNKAQRECQETEESAIIGFCRVVANENPSWTVRIVDFDDTTTKEEQKVWIQRIQTQMNNFEPEFAIRNNQIWVPRLMQVSTTLQDDNTAKNAALPYRLEISDGILENLTYHNFEPELVPGKVLIRTIAAALNFKDVMLAMNMLDIEHKHLGLEFAGIVEQVGQKSKFKVGDAVFGISEHCLASHIVANEDLVVKKPDNISFEDAATIPIVFLTTYYSLVYKANIAQDQHVLIHSAAGGVGQAAIQIVNWKKGSVIATVSSAAKRQFLRTKYGVQHFADSHSLTWDQAVRSILPQGVDIVLNSLSGEHIQKGLQVLNHGGSFIEIGKRDILADTPMGMKPFLKNLSLFSVHLDLLIETHSKLLGKMLQEIASLFQQNVFTTFKDTVYPANKTVEAFKYMQTGMHIGKIVISYQDVYPSRILPALKLFNSDKTYVLSGGLGALGFEIAQWMVQQGARYIVLMSRNCKNLKKQHLRGLQQMKNMGARVYLATVNVAQAVDVKQCYEHVQNELHFPSIGGILHLAMVLDDDSISKQNEARFDKVLQPKVDGAKNLVKLSNCSKLDFVIFFSSISSVIGNPEQSNYAASNAFLDAYAQHLQNQGIFATSINLGAVDDVGICATDFKLRKIMAAKGLQNSITVAQVLEYLPFILKRKIVQCITPFDIKSVCDFTPLLKYRMSHLINHQVIDNEQADANAAHADGIAKTIQKLLQLDSDIDENEKLTVYGVDSLLAVEISSIMGKLYGIKISQMDILAGITVSQLKTKVANK